MTASHPAGVPPLRKPDQILVDIAEYAAAPPTFSARGQRYRPPVPDGRAGLRDGRPGISRPAPNYWARSCPGTIVPRRRARAGHPFELDPILAAFNLGAMIRWLDYNDTWLAAEWGHPSDNLGGILAVADWLARGGAQGGRPLTVQDVLTALIQAYEIQGVLALENSFNRVGLDHVVLVKVATTAVVARLLGGGREEIINAVSNAWIDGQSLRTYRHAPNTGSRKSWAAGDATSRGVRLAWMAMQGEMGYPTALSAPIWGFYDAAFRGQRCASRRPYGSYVMENILFKVAFPAEFHAQTAVEAALQLHPQVCDQLDEIERVVITTQESAMRIIDKKGPLYNPADRDHCIQYMTAVPLIFGRLTAEDYEDAAARDPRIDALREKMECVEDPRYQPGLSRPGQALDRQRRPGVFSRRDGDGKGQGRISYRSPPAAVRGGAAAVR